MSKTRAITHEADCPWESGSLGTSAEHAKRAPDDHEAMVDDALGLQMISIRLPKELINDLKYLATREGIGYQPLMRRVLLRYASYEFKNIAQEQLVSELRKSEVQSKVDQSVEADELRYACG